VLERRPILNPDLRGLIEGEGFVINDAKTLLMPRFQRQRVTGIVVNEKLNVPREYYRHLRAVLHIWATYGREDAETAFAKATPVRNSPPGKHPSDFTLVVRGQVQYLGYVRNYDRVYQRLAQTLRECDPTFIPALPTTPQSGQVIFAGEGPSDAKHVFAALHALKQDFTGVHFVELEHRKPQNDQQLWEWLQAHKESHNIQPLVGIFDCDSDTYVSHIGPAGWRHLGNGVVAVALARPPWLTEDDPFCIEMLHLPSTLARADKSDRRIFLRSEFDADGVSHNKQFTMRHPRKRTLVVEDVDRVSDGKSVGLAKAAFAQAVYGRVEPYAFVDFEGFRATLERLWRAIAAAQTACS
jgi:RNA-directed DNA polymerase